MITTLDKLQDLNILNTQTLSSPLKPPSLGFQRTHLTNLVPTDGKIYLATLITDISFTKPPF